MDIRELVRFGYLEELLEDESIILERRELELLDCVYAGDDSDLQCWIDKYGDVICKSQHKAINILLQHIADCNTGVEMLELENEYKDGIYNEYDVEVSDRFKED